MKKDHDTDHETENEIDYENDTKFVFSESMLAEFIERV